MLISLFGILLNIPANYAFIYGWWFIPNMGGAGCSWATAIVMTSMMLVLLAYVLWSTSRLNKHAYYSIILNPI